MLPKKLKSSKEDIKETLKDGFLEKSGFINAKISKKEEKMSFSVIITKKNAKTSVERHLFKRRINEAIQSNLSKIREDFKRVVVFLVRNEGKVPTYKEIKKNIDEIMVKFF